MTSWEFAYWLQGAIEIGEPEAFSDEQVALIRRRVSAVTNPDRYSFTIAFVLDRCVREDLMSVIKKIQYDVFVHEIDPSYEGDQQFLLAVHRGDVDHEGVPQ